MRIHFIAIGGSAMHNLAIALHKKGYFVSGSDDEIFEPSLSRLKEHGLLPKVSGWQPDNISSNLDAVILGMHARIDNPELLRAQELGLKIYSYPEYLYEQTKDKLRIVIGGSHGKTTTTSMVMHVLKYHGVGFDYMVGAAVDGFDTMVELTKENKVAVFEGDEYLSSPIDPRPKFHHYCPNIALITGIAWDHINVFPTFDGYVEQFDIFAKMIEKQGSLIYFDGDNNLVNIAKNIDGEIETLPYNIVENVVENGSTYMLYNGAKVKLQVFGEHNLQNIAGAKIVCQKVGISEAQFVEAISTFKGSARRLEVAAKNEQTTVFYDFAHSPSKLKATTTAVKAQFPDRELVAVMELHTFSSLKKEFLPQYKGCMLAADEAWVYFDPKTIEHKKLEPISEEQVLESFGGNNINVSTNSDCLFEHVESINWSNKNLLIMTSGNFSGKNIKELAKKLLVQK